MSKTVKRDKIGQSSEVPKTEWGIQDFYSLAQQVDFARLHQFRVIEWKHNTKAVFDESKFHLYLETATLPGKEITSVVVPYIGMEFNVPCMVKYTGTSYAITLRCDQFYIIRQALEKCITNTYDDENTTAYGLVPSEDSYMVIALIGKSTQPIMKYKLIGTSVSNTGTIQYNTGDTGTVAKVEMTLSYHYWRKLPATGDTSDSTE
jgi:hypothetical protein